MTQETPSAEAIITPIAIEKGFLDGKGLTAGDPTEFDDEGVTQDEEPAAFGVHNFHAGKIMVSVYESGPAKVRIEGLPYDEFVQILEGRLILTPDGGDSFEFMQGDSLVVPAGYTGSWEMPEKYRELIIINTDYAEASDDDS